MADPAKQRATYQDVLDLPPHVVGELVDGVLHVQSRPALKHTRAGSRLGARLGGSFDSGEGGPGGWWILDEPELHLPTGDVVVPDLAGWKLARMPALPDTVACEIVPDWVCEILSPGTAAFDRRQKMPLYARVGVPYLWLVDPEPRTLDAFRLENGRWSLLATFAGDEAVQAEPFDAVPLELGALWGPPAPPR